MGSTKVTIVADAAMLSAANLAALTEAGYTYIVGSRLHKVPTTSPSTRRLEK